MSGWLKLTVPRFNKWYNRWYYRIFHPEIQCWLNHCAREVEDKMDDVLLYGKGMQLREEGDIVYGWSITDIGKEGD